MGYSALARISHHDSHEEATGLAISRISHHSCPKALNTPTRELTPTGGAALVVLFFHLTPFPAHCRHSGPATPAPARSGVRWRGYAQEGYASEQFRH